MADFNDDGTATRRAVAGDEWVEKNFSEMSEFDRPWQMYVTNVNWAGTWSRDILSKQQLSLINLAMLGGAGHMHEFEVHFRNAIVRTKVPLEQLRELLIHIGMYCGIPTGTDVFRIARRVLKEQGVDPNAIAPLDTSHLYHLPED